MRVDWKRKLSSRKFWALVAAFVTGILIFCGTSPETVEKVVALAGSFISIVTYILVEGNIDAKAAKAK